eukprot:scaffold340372_cov37-Prasinocladus_malaysianus.AAC.1
MLVDNNSWQTLYRPLRVKKRHSPRYGLFKHKSQVAPAAFISNSLSALPNSLHITSRQNSWNAEPNWLRSGMHEAGQVNDIRGRRERRTEVIGSVSVNKNLEVVVIEDDL